MSELSELIVNIQNYDIDALTREQEFGQHGFQDALEPASRLRDLYRLISPAYLTELPDQQVKNLNGTATNVFNTLQRIRNYTPSNNPSERPNLIQTLRDYYQQSFDNVVLPVLYTQFRNIDLQAALKNVEGAVRQAQTRAQELTADLEEKSKEVSKVLEDVRKAAAEQGVSQQATYFKEEADEHARVAAWWKFGTFIVAIVIFAASIGSLFLHKIPQLAPKTVIESYQLIASKILIFAVLSYMLVLCAKNFLSHKHNTVINKHRQNALMTYKALADAAGDAKLKDVILTYASACIFSPQDTGYAKGAGTPSFSGGKAVIDLIQAAGKSGD